MPDDAVQPSELPAQATSWSRVVQLGPHCWREPGQVLVPFRDEPWAIGLLSGGGGERGRWSYMLRAPDETLNLTADDLADPFLALGGLVGPVLHGARLAEGPPFQGGVVGLAAYELGDRIETLGLARAGAWPDLACGRYPSLLAFDHENQQIWSIGRGARLEDALHAAERASSWLEAAGGAAPCEGRLATTLTGEAPELYEQAVAEVTARIRRGEIFQANLARRWRGRLRQDASPFDVMARLAALSPAPFAAYMRLPGLAVVSNSPERFLQVRAEGDALIAESRPIKGTRPRGRTASQDAALARALQESLKDRAENLMIVDLMRNDLARVCSPGQVRVPELCSLESFANVHHLVSSVTGRLAPGQGPVDLMRAAFPPGSVTGAPKVQAMRVIAELEPPRGPYCGSVFWIGADGAMDASVLIRTLSFEHGAEGWRFEARAGAGLTHDSDPRAERMETDDKISMLLKALYGGEDDPA